MGRGIASALARRRIDLGGERARLESVRKHARLIKPRQADYAPHSPLSSPPAGASGRGIHTPGETSTPLNALSVTARSNVPDNRLRKPRTSPTRYARLDRRRASVTAGRDKKKKAGMVSSAQRQSCESVWGR
ncbi:hypothetical protein MTO96_023279 [Rhipicephalus appendiculatus]